MTNSKILSQPEVIKKFQCEFCQRSFIKEQTLVNHICEYKHRWQEREKKGCRIGYEAWQRFYAKTGSLKKDRGYLEFIKSVYYLAFVKFGNYCAETKVINPNRYIDWLLKEQIKIDTWNQDTVYNKFLITHLKVENHMDAVARSIETLMVLAKESNIQTCDYFRYGNINKICHAIYSGKISPWILYQSASGVEFLSKLTEDQLRLINDYIDPEKWAIKFIKEADSVENVKSLLTTAGF